MGLSLHTFANQRRRVAAWLVASLLFSQWAVAAYVCPALRDALASAAMTAKMDGADMADCPGMKAGTSDGKAPLMCKAHCEQSQHAFDKSATAADVAQITPMLVALLDWRPVRVRQIGSPGLLSQPSATGPPPGWPPLFLAFLVLRN